MTALPPREFRTDAAPATPLQQSPQFVSALLAYGTPVISDDPVILQRGFGPLPVRFASRVTASALSRLAHRERPRVINGEQADDAAYRALGYRKILTSAHIATWDLTRPKRLECMHGKWRNRLRRGWDAGLRIRELKWAGQPHEMFTAAEAVAHAQRFSTYPTALLSRYAAVNAGHARIYEAYDRGHLCAACLVLRHGNQATYQTAWATERGKALQAPRVLLTHAADALSKLGHTWFDLGIVDTDHALGLARFKLGSGADLRKLGGTWLRMP